MPVNYATPAADQLFPVAGIRLGTAEAEIRKKNRRDLTLVALDDGCTVAGVFTQNRFCAAPVQLCRRPSGGRQGHSRAGHQYRDRQCRYRRAGNAGGTGNLRRGRQVARHRRRTGAAVFHRRHSRAAPGRSSQGGVARRAGRPQGRQLACRGARHHDDRHRRQGRVADCRGQRQKSDHFRRFQGRRHDPAEHGDHARFRRHRRRHRPAAARPAGQGGGRCLLQLHHRRWRHLDQRLAS